MSTYTKYILTGSTNGRPIRINATAATGTTIHTSVSGTTDMDEVWAWACNTATADVTLTVEFGGTSGSDNVIFTVPAKDGLYQILPGTPMNNTLVVRAYASASESINVVGYANRITA